MLIVASAVRGLSGALLGGFNGFLGVWAIAADEADIMLVEGMESIDPSTPLLRIATRLIRPDAFKENGQIVGFSADTGRTILEQLQRQAVIKTYPGVPEILDAIRSRQADLGGAAIAITRQREQDFEFCNYWALLHYSC